MTASLDDTILALQIEQGVKFVGVRFHESTGFDDLPEPQGDEFDVGEFGEFDEGGRVKKQYMMPKRKSGEKPVRASDIPASWKRQLGAAEYVYKTTLDLAKGDVVLVEARNHYQVVTVTNADAMDTIEFGSNIRYRWVVCALGDALEETAENVRRERAAKRNVTTARMQRESRDILADMKLHGEGVTAPLLIGNHTPDFPSAEEVAAKTAAPDGDVSNSHDSRDLTNDVTRD